MRTNPKAFLAVLGVLLLLSACRSDPVGVNGDFSGMYTLISISGNLIPFTAPIDTTTSVTFTGGSFTITPGLDFSETIVYEITTSGVTTPTTSTCPGTYTQSGNGFTFTEPLSDTNQDCGGTYFGNANSTTLVVNFALGFQAVFTK